MARGRNDPEEVPGILTTFRAEVATPEDVERLIDARIAQLDEDIAQKTKELEEKKTERKRWLGVTGGKTPATRDYEVPKEA